MTAVAPGQLVARLREILADFLVIGKDEVRPESLLVDDLDADSITFIEVWVTLEQEFKVRLPEVKATEENFGLTLEEGLAKLRTSDGDLTLFEFLIRSGVVQRVTIGEFAAAVGGRVPTGMDAQAPAGTLRVRELIRFVTVAALASYVEYLIEAQGKRPCAGT